MERLRNVTSNVSSTDKVCAVRWVDNKVVTMVSHHHTKIPVVYCKGYQKQTKGRMYVKQLQMIVLYNKYMGGVAQLYRRYWTQLINLVRILQVAAY